MMRPSRLARFLLIAAAFDASAEAAAQMAACDINAAPCCGPLANPSAAAQPAAAAPAFGVQIWPAGLAKTPQAMERLIALGPRHLRFALGPNWARQPAIDPAMTDAELDAFISRGFASSPLAAEIEVLRALKSRTGATLHLVIWAPPPLPSEAAARAPGGGRTMRREDIAIAARFDVALLKHLAERGVAIDAVELSNEPDADWNIRIAPPDYLALIEAARAEAKRRGVALPQIYGPGASSVAGTRAFLAEPRTARAILDAVDTLSIHGWDNPARRDRLLEFESLLDDLRRLDRKPAIALTEYGLARPDPADASDRMNVKKRAADHVANTLPYGIQTARDMLRFYGAGVGAIIHWEFQDQNWGHSSFGLLDARGDERPIYGVLGALSHQLAARRPQSIAPAGADDLFVFKYPEGESLWSANAQPQARTIIFTGNARPQRPTCRDSNGHPGLTIQPWSLTATPIERP